MTINTSPSVLDDSTSQIHALETCLDLVWRFVPGATICDCSIVALIVTVSNVHTKRLRGKVVDTEDSRAILKTYIRGIPMVDADLYRLTTVSIGLHLPFFIRHNILSGAENICSELAETIIDRLWEMLSWGKLHGENVDVADLIDVGLQDLCIVLDIYIKQMLPDPSQYPIIQIVLETLAKKDLLDLIGLGIQNSDPSKGSEGLLLSEASCLISSTLPDYFSEYVSD
ncbi:hypothetical protein RHS03_00689, partial [Rhizoctonia solani]